MLDIKNKSKNFRAARLSNFQERHFTFRGIKCTSIEGALQASKERDVEKRRRFCKLHGIKAKRASCRNTTWKVDQKRYWDGEEFLRGSAEDHAFTADLFTSAYEDDPAFRYDLLATAHEELDHSISDVFQRDTTLTLSEMMHQVYRLRSRAHHEYEAGEFHDWMQSPFTPECFTGINKRHAFVDYYGEVWRIVEIMPRHSIGCGNTYQISHPEKDEVFRVGLVWKDQFKGLAYISPVNNSFCPPDRYPGLCDLLQPNARIVQMEE